MTIFRQQSQDNSMREVVQSDTQPMTYGEAVRRALREAMLSDPRVFLIGEDIGIYGGAFGVTKGLLEEFGRSVCAIRPSRSRLLRAAP